MKRTTTFPRSMSHAAVLAATLAAAPQFASAQSAIVSLGTGGPTSIAPAPAGGINVGGSGIGSSQAGIWNLNGSAISVSTYAGTGLGTGYLSLDGQYAAVIIPNTGPQILGNTATGVTPPFNPNPTLTPGTVPETTQFRAARLNVATGAIQDLGGLPIDGSLLVFGSGSSGGSTGTFMNPNAISSTGRFIVGLGYISTYNSAAGNTISANTFQWRAWVWDAQGNGGLGSMTVLPTPFRTSTNTWRRRTGNPYAVSTDGTVILGAQEHNVGTTPTADPDGGRYVVWRLNSGSGLYEMSYLPNGVNSSGFPITYSSTPRTVLMNAAGTIIVGMAVDSNGAAYLGKWTWDAGTSTWSNPENLGSNLAVEATWLPGSVTSCGLPPIITPTSMTEDASVIVGSARYSTCGSFMTGGFIWTADDSAMLDWYDYLVAVGVPDVTAQYGPIGDLGDPTRGLPKLGTPLAITADGNAVAGAVLGPQFIVGAPPSLVLFTGGPSCVPPVVTGQPTTPTNFSACTSSIILNTSAAGTLPIAFQWHKGGAPLSDGATPSGSVITGATSFQLRVNPPLTPSDAGTYHATATGPCGTPASSSNAIVQLDPAFPAATNDVCLDAMPVGMGTNVLAPAQSPCGAYINDPANSASCFNGALKTDRWFAFTPSSAGNYRVETCGANYDTVLSLFDDCGGPELACNDNYTTGPSAGCTSNRSRIGSYALSAGETYYIRIAAPINTFLSTTSTMNLSITIAPPSAPNDSCSLATPAILGSNPFDTTEATTEGFGASCAPTAVDSRDVWFQYTPPTPGLLRAATCPGTTINTVLTIHDGLCGSELACNDNANVAGCTNQSIIQNFHVDAGRTYAFRVSGNNGATLGAGVLTLSLDCDADINNNGVIDLADLSILLTNFGCSSGCTVDLNGDGVTDLADLSILLGGFGQACM
jgi:hypothetical protein